MSDTKDSGSDRCEWVEDGEVCGSEEAREVVISHGESDYPRTTEHLCADHLQRAQEVNFRTVHDDGLRPDGGTADSEHGWELKGGGETIPADGPGMGLTLWQCRACDLAASRALTYNQERLDAIVPPPDVDEPCTAGGDNGR